jgi:hypothetical protein
MMTNELETIQPEELSFDPEHLRHVVAESADLLEVLVPGACVRNHVKAFCEQAPVVRYLEVAAGSSEWNDANRRKFVRQHRGGKIPSSLIIQLAYVACTDSPLTGGGIDGVLNAVNDVEHNHRHYIEMHRGLAQEHLVIGHFGTLVDSQKQDELRQSEVNMLQRQISNFERFPENPDSPISTMPVYDSKLIVPRAGLWREQERPDRLEILDLCKDKILDELAKHACLRHQALGKGEDELKDILGVTISEVIERTVDHYMQAKKECAIFGVEYHDKEPPLSVWEELGWEW